jgi:hypothetical protein
LKASWMILTVCRDHGGLLFLSPPLSIVIGDSTFPMEQQTVISVLMEPPAKLGVATRHRNGKPKRRRNASIYFYPKLTFYRHRGMRFATCL